MPDWVTHIGIGYLFSRRICREDLSLALIGSILPDVISRIEVILFDFLHLFIFKDFSFRCFHTPFMLACLCMAVALLNIRPARTFTILFVFSLLHLFLDIIQVSVPGAGVLLFFPFSYKDYSLNLFNPKDPGYLVFFVFFLSILLWSLFHAPPSPSGHWSKQRLKWIPPILLFLIIFPFYASHTMFKHNIDSAQFLDNPDLWEGKNVYLHVSRVISSNPVRVEEGGKHFEVITTLRIREGEWISLQGIYSKGKIVPNIIVPNMPPLRKAFFSVIGFLYLIVFFVLQRKKSSSDNWYLHKHSQYDNF